MPAEDPDSYFTRCVSHASQLARVPLRLLQVEEVSTGWQLRLAVRSLRLTVSLSEDRPARFASRSSGYYFEWLMLDQPAHRGRSKSALDAIALLVTRALARADDALAASGRPTRSGGRASAARPPWEGSRPTLALSLPGQCDRACLFCGDNLRRGPRPLDEDRASLPPDPSPEFAELELERLTGMLERARAEGGPRRIHFGGSDCLGSPIFDRLLLVAYQLGFRGMQVTSPGSRLVEPGFLEHLRSHGVSRLSLTVMAASDDVFDRVAGRRGAAAIMWATLEALRDSDLVVGLRVPMVRQNLDEIPAVLERLAPYRHQVDLFYWFPEPPFVRLFGEIAPSYGALAEVLTSAEGTLERVSAAIENVPRCVLPASLERRAALRYDAQWPELVGLEFRRVEACQACPEAARACPGLNALYLETWGLPRMRALGG